MDKLRADFEADFENETGWSAGEYPSQEVVDLCWRLYQQSRASIVVDLPYELRVASITDKKVQQAFVNGHLFGLKECTEAIRSIGLSIKGE